MLMVDSTAGGARDAWTPCYRVFECWPETANAGAPRTHAFGSTPAASNNYPCCGVREQPASRLPSSKEQSLEAARISNREGSCMKLAVRVVLLAGQNFSPDPADPHPLLRLAVLL